MSPQPTYEELERKVEELEKAAIEQKMVDDHLLREKNDSNSIIDSLPGIFYLFNEFDVFTRWNKNFEAVSGYSAEEISRMSPLDFFDDKDKAEVKRKIEAVFTGKQSAVEADFISKDGTRIPYYLTGLRILIGSSHYLAGMGIDMTTIKQAEKVLREREQNYRSFFENNHAMMLLIDPESAAIIDANPAACGYYGYSREEFKALQITDINTLSQEQVFHEMRLAEKEKRNYFNFRHRLANGIVRDVEVYSGPITMQAKILLYSIIHDVTDRNQATAERERLIIELRDALAEVKTLRGFIPICAGCKKIRDDEGYWKQIEEYIQARSEAQFSHSICPECTRKLYPELEERRKSKPVK